MAGQRYQLVLVSAVGAGLGGRQDGQERMGDQGQDGPAVPGCPAADLVLVQRGQFLAGSEPVLNQPPIMPLKPQRSLALALRPGR